LNNILSYTNDKDFSPYYFLLISTYYIAVNLNKRDLKILILLISAESIIGILEFGLGISSVIPGYEIESISSREHLLYYKRVFGLSSNSSIFAYKVLIAIILIHYLKLIEVKYKIIIVLLYAAVLVSFNRTVIISLIIFYFIIIFNFSKKILYSCLRNRIHKSDLLKSVLLIFSIFIIIVLLFIKFEDVIVQFTRNTGEIEMSGRNLIWPQFISFIKQNLWFGNGSYKYFIDYFGINAHAHNAYIQIVATNGIFIALLYFLLVLLNIKKKNALYIFIFLIFSIMQYGIFWGISLADIIVYSMLFVNREKLLEEDEKIFKFKMI